MPLELSAHDGDLLFREFLSPREVNALKSELYAVAP